MNTSSDNNQNTKPPTGPNRDNGAGKQNPYIVFAVVALALLMSSIDSTIVAVGLPTLMTDLRTNLALVTWTLTGYQFAQSVIMPIAGKLSDEWGRKRLFLIAVIIFTASSLASGFAPNIYFLIVFRILQGVGGGAFIPSATGIVSDAFGKKRATAIGLFGSIFPIGGIIGPNIGGFIIDSFSWHWIFFINIPLGLLIFLLGLKILPKGNTARSISGKIDAIGAGLFVGAILAVMYAITYWANNPHNPGILTWILFAVGVALFVLFFRHEDRCRQPMIETKLLRWRPFLAINVYNFLLGAAVFGFFSFVPYYATIAYGMSATQAGLVLTPRSVAMIIFTAITSFLITRLHYRKPMIIGAVIISVSMAILSRGFHDITIFGIGFHNLLLLSLLVMLGGVGVGIANPAANNAALDLIPEKTAAAAGMRGFFRSTGGVFGTATVSLLLSYFNDKVAGLQIIYLGFAVLTLVLIPLVFMVPDIPGQRINRDVKAGPPKG